MCRVNIGHLRVTIGHVGHCRLLKVTVGSLQMGYNFTMLMPDLAAVNWLWPFKVQDQIYGC